MFPNHCAINLDEFRYICCYFWHRFWWIFYEFHWIPPPILWRKMSTGHFTRLYLFSLGINSMTIARFVLFRSCRVGLKKIQKNVHVWGRRFLNFENPFFFREIKMDCTQQMTSIFKVPGNQVLLKGSPENTPKCSIVAQPSCFSSPDGRKNRKCLENRFAHPFQSWDFSFSILLCWKWNFRNPIDQLHLRNRGTPGNLN